MTGDRVPSRRRAMAVSGLLAMGLVGGATVHGADSGALAAAFADVCIALDGPMFASAPARPGGVSRPATVVKTLSCEALPNVPGKSITTALVEYPANAYTPAHRHPGAVTAYVIEGTIRSQLAGGPVVDYHAGQTWFEPPRTVHLFAENPDATKTARLLATFVTDDACGPLVLPPDD